MKKKQLILLIAALLTLLLTACGKDSTDYEHLRDVSWEGTELTITLGENQSSGCVWSTIPEDDSVIDYSINRVFNLADSKATNGEAIGSLEAGFEGKGAGTSRILCTTPVGWDGTGDGFSYIVTVTVNEDGTIENAVGEEGEPVPAEDVSGSAATVEEYFSVHTDELEAVKEQLNANEDLNQYMTIDIYAKGNDVYYIYTLKETYPKDQIEANLPEFKSSMIGETRDSLKEQIKTMEDSLGLEGIRIIIEYHNGDGSLIFSDTVE